MPAPRRVAKIGARAVDAALVGEGAREHEDFLAALVRMLRAPCTGGEAHEGGQAAIRPLARIEDDPLDARRGSGGPAHGPGHDRDPLAEGIASGAVRKRRLLHARNSSAEWARDA